MCAVPSCLFMGGLEVKLQCEENLQEIVKVMAIIVWPWLWVAGRDQSCDL